MSGLFGFTGFGRKKDDALVGDPVIFDGRDEDFPGETDEESAFYGAEAVEDEVEGKASRRDRKIPGFSMRVLILISASFVGGGGYYAYDSLLATTPPAVKTSAPIQPASSAPISPAPMPVTAGAGAPLTATGQDQAELSAPIPGPAISVPERELVAPSGPITMTEKGQEDESIAGTKVTGMNRDRLFEKKNRIVPKGTDKSVEARLPSAEKPLQTAKAQDPAPRAPMPTPASAADPTGDSEPVGNARTQQLVAAAKGKQMFDLEQSIRIKKAELELAKLEAQIAAEKSRVLNPVAPQPVPDATSMKPKEKPRDPELNIEQMLMSLGSDGGPGGQGGGGGGLRRPAVTGISDSGAVVNGKMVTVGQSVDGFKVTGINPKKGTVMLSLRGSSIEVGL
jgi:hypothetical protein